MRHFWDVDKKAESQVPHIRALVVTNGHYGHVLRNKEKREIRLAERIHVRS